jgi:hypothetical protein
MTRPKAHPFTRLSAATLTLVLLTGCGDDDGGADRERFCQLAREREAQQPDIDFEHATQAEVKQALSAFVERVKDNVAKAKRVAPPDIADDFAQGVADTRNAADTGDLSRLDSPAGRRVGEYIEKECGTGP